MRWRWLLALVLSSTMAPAWSRAVSVRVQLLTPQHITIVAGQPYRQPIRIRLVRAADAVPVPGVPVHFYALIMSCAPLIQCELPTWEAYGFWEGAGDPSSLEARASQVTTDARGEATLPTLVGGTRPWWYEIDFFVSPSDGFELDYASSPHLIVQQEAAPVGAPRAIPAAQPLGMAIALLMMLVGAFRYRTYCT